MMKKRTRTRRSTKRPGSALAVRPPAPEITRRKTSEEEGGSCVAVYMASLGSEKSRASIYGALKRVVRVLGFRIENELVRVEDFPWEKIRYRHMQVIRARLSSSCSPNTANHTLSAVRGVLEVAWKQRKISTDNYQRARSVKGVKGSRVQAGRHIRFDEVQKLFDVCGDSLSGVRDAAILSLLYGCGLRRSEVASVQLHELDIEAPSVRLIGKGNKERITYLPPGAAKAIARWLEVRGDAPGPLFVGISKHGVLTKRGSKGISDDAIRKCIARIELATGVKHMTPHDFRRTYIGDMLENGVDIATVQKLVGHSSPNTTARYDRRGEKTRKRAAEMLKVPYKDRK